MCILGHLLIYSRVVAQSTDRFRNEFYILWSDYLVDTTQFVKTFEDKDFYVLQKASDIQTFKLNIGKVSYYDSLKVFYVSIKDSLDENNIYLYTHESWCRIENDKYDIINGFGIVPHSAIARVWRTQEGFFYVKYIGLVEPDVNHVIEFLIKDKKDDGWWNGASE